MTTLPDADIPDPDVRYDRAVRSYNVQVGRFNAAVGALEWAEREYRDAESALSAARYDLDRAATAAGRPGPP